MRVCVHACVCVRMRMRKYACAKQEKIAYEKMQEAYQLQVTKPKLLSLSYNVTKPKLLSY